MDNLCINDVLVGGSRSGRPLVMKVIDSIEVMAYVIEGWSVTEH